MIANTLNWVVVISLALILAPPVKFTFLVAVTHKDGLFKSELSKLIIVARSRHDELWLEDLFFGICLKQKGFFNYRFIIFIQLLGIFSSPSFVWVSFWWQSRLCLLLIAAQLTILNKTPLQSHVSLYERHIFF